MVKKLIDKLKKWYKRKKRLKNIKKKSYGNKDPFVYK